jgi:ABC-type antimicrobial peptide transport system permease subunit
MNIKQSLRIIFRNKTYSILNIAGLAIGITASALILLWVEYQVNDNRSVPKMDYLYDIGQIQYYGDDARHFFVAPGPLSEALNSNFAGIRTSTRYSDTGIGFELGDKTFFEKGVYADSTLFSMINLPFVAGNPDVVFDPAYSIVVSRKMALKIFGNTDIVGQTLKVGANLYEITGVFEDRELNGSFRFEWLIPFRVYEDALVAEGRVQKDHWGSNWLKCYVEIVPGADVAGINQRLTSLFTERSDWDDKTQMFIFPLKDMRLYSDFVDGKPTGSGYIRTVRMFFWIGMVILLIACINFMNLSTARSEKRSMEVGVRKTFGAKYPGLVRQFMGESTVITVISLLIALLLVNLCLPPFNSLINYQLAVDFSNPYHLFGLIAAGIVCAVSAGVYPAVYLSSFSPIQALRKMNRNVAGGAVWVRKGLVVFQFAISFVLICATMVIYLQIHHVYKRPLGIEMDRLTFFPATDEVKRGFAAIQQELVNTGYVANAGLSSQHIIRLWSNGGGYQWQGKDENTNPLVSNVNISPDIFATAGMRMEGSDFSFQNFGEKPEVVINRSFATLMGEEGRVGGFVSRGGDPMQIIGIVDDFIFNDISRAKAEPVIFFPGTGNAGNLFVKFAKDKPVGEAMVAVQKVLQAHSPGKSFEPVFMDETFDRMFYNYRFTGKLASLFAILAIFLSCLGLFGLSAYSAEQRTKEIGIRKILGASVWSIIHLLGSNFMKLILSAFAIAVPAGWYASYTWLQSYGYRVSLSWYIFAATGVLVIVIAMLTVSMQAIKSATANPIKSIKTE